MRLLLTVLLAFLVALMAVIVVGAIAIRRHNAKIKHLRRNPVTPMRFRHLNVVNRCDSTLACLAKSHEPTCVRGRKERDDRGNA